MLLTWRATERIWRGKDGNTRSTVLRDKNRGAPLGPGWGPGHLGCGGAHAWWQDGYIRDAGRPRGHMAAPAQDARGRVVLRLLGSRLLVLARADARGERLALA